MTNPRSVPTYQATMFRDRSSDICVMIPVINEGERIVRQLTEMQALALPFDVFLLDGGSTDGSMDHQRLASLGLRGLLLKTGPGKLSAQLRMGYSFALEQGYDGIITIDGNGKDGIEAIPLMADALRNGYDYVQGSRFIRGGVAERTPLLRLLGIRLVHAPILSLAAKRWLTDTTNGFRGYSRAYLEHPGVQPFRDVFLTYELLAYLSVRASQLRLRVIELPVRRSYPADGSVPTKIHSFGANIGLVRIVIRAARGGYHPVDGAA